MKEEEDLLKNPESVTTAKKARWCYELEFDLNGDDAIAREYAFHFIDIPDVDDHALVQVKPKDVPVEIKKKVLNAMKNYIEELEGEIDD